MPRAIDFPRTDPHRGLRPAPGQRHALAHAQLLYPDAPVHRPNPRPRREARNQFQLFRPTQTQSRSAPPARLEATASVPTCVPAGLSSTHTTVPLPEYEICAAAVVSTTTASPATIPAMVPPNPPISSCPRFGFFSAVNGPVPDEGVSIVVTGPRRGRIDRRQLIDPDHQRSGVVGEIEHLPADAIGVQIQLRSAGVDLKTASRAVHGRRLQHQRAALVLRDRAGVLHIGLIGIDAAALMSPPAFDRYGGGSKLVCLTRLACLPMNRPPFSTTSVSVPMVSTATRRRRRA